MLWQTLDLDLRWNRKGMLMDTGHDLRRKDLRRAERQPCDHSVTVTWRGAGGEDRFTQAKAIDICESGLRLQMPESLDRQSYLTLRASKLNLVGPASVRHCTRIRGGKFAVGLEFSGGMRWTPRVPVL